MHPILPTAQAQKAMLRLEEHGFEVFAVGGCVRDSLLGREPNDWDLTTSALPHETAACFSDHRVIETGMQHGTVTVLIDDTPIEITTYRLDGAYADNRHPIEVTFSRRVEDDLSRRDFTVNAMAYHPNRGLIDPFGGQDDLRAGLIRCVGDPKTRFEEDGLRILRAIRFASVLGFSVEDATAQAVLFCRHLLANIAVERIREELCKLVMGRDAASILRTFAPVVGECLPELVPCFGFAQNSRYHCYDVWEHTLHALAETSSPSLTARLAVLLHDIGKPHCYTEDSEGGHFKGHAEIGVELADALLRRLRFDNATRERLLLLIRYHDIPISDEPRRVRRLLLRLGADGIRDLLEVKRCDRLSHAPAYRALPDVLRTIPIEVERILRENDCLSLRSLAVNGQDLLTLGFPPDKRLGSTLQALLDRVIDGDLPNSKPILLQEASRLLGE